LSPKSNHGLQQGKPQHREEGIAGKVDRPIEGVVSDKKGTEHIRWYSGNGGVGEEWEGEGAGGGAIVAGGGNQMVR
jgi:hypothetical protein